MSGLIRQTANGAAAPLSYTGAFNDEATGAVTAGVIFTPAANVNGAYVELIGVSIDPSTAGGTAFAVNIIAKNAAPASSTDGDVIFTAKPATGNASFQGVALNRQSVQRIKIAAGKGLYLNQVGNSTGAKKTVLYTLL